MTESTAVCIGDTHFQYGHWRNTDRIASMAQVISEGIALPHLGAWIHLGDIWHIKPTDEDLETVAEFFQRMAEQAPVIALLGNHGAAGYSLLMRRLKARYPIIVLDAPQVIAVPMATGETLTIAALPYPQKSVLVASGIAPGDIKRTAEQALDVICMDLASHLQQAAGPKMLIGHATIAGSTASTGQPMGIEHDIAVTASMLSRFGDVPKVFGHIHEPQTIFGAVYAGSTAPTDWGETTPRRYLVVEFREKKEYAVVSRPLNTHALYHVEGNISRDNFDWQVRKGPDGPQDEPPASWDGADVRVRYRYPAAERDVLTTVRSRIAALFPDARRLEIEPIAVTIRELRAPEVVQAKTLDEKLKAWARLSGVSWSAEITRCAEALLASEDGDSVVAGVEARLNRLASERAI